MANALIAVFGMDKDGRIAKEKACNVVKQLGLVKEEEGESRFDILEEELEVKEVLKDLEVEEKNEKEQLLKQAFMVFDEDNDGYIDAKEIKRIFVCLGLDNGWDMIEIEKMIKAVDLNLDGKVDFHEFELMME
ncbi:putative calcium-binding protein CML45 [Silene latifolia]|uniref:putative calcium-binding protein CML45 n=1 Tax=Silene latifolia TaxID=37657 RepID=UPI003D772D24